MYSKMRSTSAVYPSYPCHREQSNDEKPQPGFGEHHSEQLNGQLHSAMNPSYLTPASYQMHQNQNHGFGVQQSSLTNIRPFYQSVKNPSYSPPASYLMHQNQPHGFGVQQSSMINNGPLRHPLKDPIFSTPASYPMHQNQNYGFGVPQSSMTNNRLFYYPGFTYHPPQEAPTYPVRQHAAVQAQEAPTFRVHQPAAVQVQEATTYLVHQPSAAQAQEALTYLVHQPVAAQAQQVELKRNAEEEVLDVNLEVPIFPMSKPRLKWTPELHERFIRATTQLGGLFKATPKAILKKMNVRGLTPNHLKSHLQKMRYKNPNDRPVEEVMGNGIQNTADSYAPFTEDDLSSSYRANYESNIGKNGSLLKSSETPNYQQNLWIASGEDHDNDLDSKDFDHY